ncbi:MAG: NAD-dependent epimerase/dehydratase family protein [Sumerlaeia bacterium]
MPITPSSQHILITGGAGFIGSHLADELLARGHKVRVLDCLHPQVHGEGQQRPEYLSPEVELQVGNVADASAVERALVGIDSVVHFAARVGVGQSMYEVTNYMAANSTATGTLLEVLAKHPIRRLLVASSMSIYGEGLYRSPSGKTVANVERTLEDLKARRWEPFDPETGEQLQPIPTPESKTPILKSVYALSKYDQERLCLMLGEAHYRSTVALRFFNIYGTRQALSNPYTGVLAIFASRLLNGNRPLVYEDGEQMRDFTNVKDVARACRMALEADSIPSDVYNVGAAQPLSIREIAERLAEVMNVDFAPELAGKYRFGDIRHCYADVTRAREAFGFEAKIDFNTGLAEYMEWLANQSAVDSVEQANRELQTKGLTT